uniref:Uncharacterized protein n=1 Tax=Romanomermis culicivorax TaxID=13658 RepID=A0A915IBR5_ROMCU
FATDQEISRTLNGESNKKVLEVWEPDSHPDEDDEHFFDAEHTKDGWAVEDMFEKNKTFGVVSTYEADLSQFSKLVSF